MSSSTDTFWDALAGFFWTCLACIGLGGAPAADVPAPSPDAPASAAP
ncbi:MAG: hypothetical protein JWM80_273 [Cyanobacteria bacterium RYN_339]|nr:hypothetical protein [Cyanobacteria bacterium RYN_339]